MERQRRNTNDASLGELHEQMEEEQEGQVVSLLNLWGTKTLLSLRL